MNHHQEDHLQMNSSEEVDQPEEEYDPNDHVGTGRSYECMFCKRGFTTAQALGGHMNIHRKDRAKNRPNNSSAKQINDQESSYYAAGPRIYHPIFSSYPPQYLTAQEEAVQFHYRTYFPSTSGATRLSCDQNINHNTMISHSRDQFSHRIISPCGEDLRMGLSLQYGNSSYGEDMDHQKKSTSWIGNREEDGLDLELRLGHHP